MGRKARSDIDRAIARAVTGRSDEAASRARRLPGGWARWIEAYGAAARGEFDRALRVAEPLAVDARDRAVRVHASITAGSALRQTGRYRAALVHDRRASVHARTASERAHALIGLAADAIGMGYTALCGRRLAEAAAVAPGRDWRCSVRLDWVRTEHSLAIGRPDAAVRSARRALRRAVEADARRHVAKSHLFLGAALGEAGREAASAQQLQRALRAARACDAGAIARVARSMLANE